MSKSKKRKLNSLRSTINSLMKSAGNVEGPAEFLASIASGKDPRAIKSTLYKLVKRIGPDVPEQEDWD